MSKYAPKGNILDDFFNGCIKGFIFVATAMAPAMIMAMAIVQVLNVTGLMSILTNVFKPFMGLFGLPGETGIALITGWLNTPSGLALCVDYYAKGIINGAQLAIMIPIMWACGSCLQMTGRVLGACQLNKKYYFPVYIISWICAIVIGLLGRVCNAIFF